MVVGKELKMGETDSSASGIIRMNDISGEDYVHYNQLRSNSNHTKKMTVKLEEILLARQDVDK